MRAFAALIARLDATTRTTAKVAALADYFTQADPADAAWALWVLSGRKVRRAVRSGDARAWLAEVAGLPAWIVEECYASVGDLAETLALLAPEIEGAARAESIPLNRVVDELVLPLPGLDPEMARATVVGAWARFGAEERFVYNKLLTGAFRLGVGRRLVIRGLAQATGLDEAVLAHRTTGPWDPTPEGWAALTAPEGEGEGGDPGRPYPFFLAHPVDEARSLVEQLGPADGWQAEWKWDGIRAQLIRRGGEVLLWSRGEELVTDQFPELAEAARAIPDGTVLDGEVLAWPDDERAPLPFARLQTRLNRRRLSRALLASTPVRFLAYDLLEDGGRDIRDLPLDERRARLAGHVVGLGWDIALSHPVEPEGVWSWAALEQLRASARERGVEGLMLKRRSSPYRQGRPRGDWFKWKVEPLTLDAVLVYARRGHGRRALLYTDYTFAVWHEGELVTVASAYSGLTDAEIREVDRWIRANAVEKFGPVRAVPPELVFELACDAVATSSRHRAGVALRFPRILRWRRDKPAAEADTLERVKALLPAGGA